MADVQISQRSLSVLDGKENHEFAIPTKRINDGDDVEFFLASVAYRDLWSFIFQLNASMFPRTGTDGHAATQAWELDQPRTDDSSTVVNLRDLLGELTKFINEAPPDKGPRRFGNISFRKWYQIVEERISDLLAKHLPASILDFGGKSEGQATSKDELKAYLCGSFGSAQRLDYGTGHELSFLAFLGCMWKLGAFEPSQDGQVERSIVLGVIEPYLELIRKLILTYTLEPAGSHGVWGLDDHSFVPYIFGSAQLGPPIRSPSDIASEGSLDGAPNPADVAKAVVVERERKKNMYFSAVGFIYDVKKGPFWEHSPILFDISGVKAGWAKINKGMMKMYNVEVFSKFPVVQHFPFGSIFRWERDPQAAASIPTTHTRSQPAPTAPGAGNAPLRDPMAAGASTRSSTSQTGFVGNTTQAPWASSQSTAQGNMPTTTAPWARPGGSSAASGQTAMPPMRAPWASGQPSKR